MYCSASGQQFQSNRSVNNVNKFVKNNMARKSTYDNNRQTTDFTWKGIIEFFLPVIAGGIFLYNRKLLYIGKNWFKGKFDLSDILKKVIYYYIKGFSL